MALSTSQKARAPHHVRTVVISSFEREDGRVDIEGTLKDEKAFDYVDRERGVLPPGSLIHSISVRVTIDTSMTVMEIEADLDQVPFTYCGGGADNLRDLVGRRLDRGWRNAANEALGGIRGCTHLMELCAQLPTVAFQTLSTRKERERRLAGESDATQKELPFYVNGCHSWNVNGPIVARYLPQFSESDDKNSIDHSEPKQTR